MSERYQMIDDEQLDRLVDGELNAKEYQSALESLEGAPDGWRRCALAFLESQAWHREFKEQSEADSRPRPRRDETTVSGPLSRNAILALAMSVSFLAAFGLGVQWRKGGLWPDEKNAPLKVVEQRRESPDEPAGQLADNRLPKTDGAAEATPAVTGARAWGQLTLVMDQADGTAKEIELPVFRPEQLRDGWFENSQKIPDHVQRDFRRLGYEVRRDLRWAPIELDPGRRVFVPLGEIEIVPVSQNLFH